MFSSLLIIVWSLLATQPAHDAGNVATAGFRAEHKQIHVELDEASTLVGQLTMLPEEGQTAAMAKIIDFVAIRIAPHAGFEEEKLYPLVDRHAGSGANAFTASMRYEHRIVERWLGDLKAIAGSPKPDVVSFSRKADQLLGLIIAHFEEEEEVLLPVLDKVMTAEEFETAMHGSAHGH